VPRGVGPAGAAREFIRAFNERDLDAFVATLHPEIEIHASRGLRSGIEDARAWATRPPGGVQQRIEVDDVCEEGDRAVALIRREWWWDEDDADDLAGTDVMAWAFELSDGHIRSWRSFEDREAALAWLKTGS
jgi:limonene-1,2-epoxide hydrolase